MRIMVVLAGLPGLLTDVLEEQLAHRADLNVHVLTRDAKDDLAVLDHDRVVVVGTASQALDDATAALRGRALSTRLVVVGDGSRTMEIYDLRFCGHDVSLDTLIEILQGVTRTEDIPENAVVRNGGAEPNAE